MNPYSCPGVSRSQRSTSSTCSGSASSAAWPCSKLVSTIASGCALLQSWRISSSPGASGIGQLPRPLVGLGGLRIGPAVGPTARPLLGADRVVAPPPALVGVALDQPLQLVEAVKQRLRARWAAGDVDVHRHELVRPLH